MRLRKIKGMIVICDDFRLNVQDVLERRGWTRRRLATILGVTPARITHLLNGRHDPGLEIVGRVAAALEVPVSDLLEKRSPMQKKTG